MANLQKGVLDKVEHFLNKTKYDYEVIVVDDGSRDGSVEFVEKFVSENPRFTLIKSSHMGKAGAVTTGVLEAKGDFILFTDMDQATPIEELEKLLPPAKDEGYDIVIGSRSTTRKGAPLSRKFMANAAIILRKLIVGLRDIKDTQCGFKLFSQKAAKDIFSKIKEIHRGFHPIYGSSVTAGFDMELLYVAEKKGYAIKEVPVNWLYVETRRVSPLRDSIQGVFELIHIKQNDIKGIYN